MKRFCSILILQGMSLAFNSRQKNVVKIKMTGNLQNDFKAANEATGFSNYGKDAPILNGKQYTWHHLDDFNPITGECTIQLVEQSVHTKIPGMTHSGAVAQYKTYYGNGYNN